MPVPMELSRIIISETTDQQVIYLKEIGGERTFPILIGIFEATSIDRRVKGYPSPRPLTHDLIVSVVENLGAEFRRDRRGRDLRPDAADLRQRRRAARRAGGIGFRIWDFRFQIGDGNALNSIRVSRNGAKLQI